MYIRIHMEQAVLISSKEASMIVNSETTAMQVHQNHRIYV